MDLEDQNVLVTGASRGIGRAAAEAFAEAGARVAVHYGKSRSRAEELVGGLPGEGHYAVAADLGDTVSVEALAEGVVERFGRLHVLVNNAGIYEQHPPTEVSFDEWKEVWERTLTVNLLGPAHLSFLLGLQMAEQGGGRIVNVSSRGAFRGEPEAPAYGASKAGLNALGQSLARALAPHGVSVCTVAPGWVATDMARPHLQGPEGEAIRTQSPLGRVASPREIARAILFLAEPGNEYLTGCILDANGASYLRS
ncbi:MAG: SDR family oxidoreductase [Thermoanaerobaculia bacterium]|nr:SDR family oxidoreductase [Thermoanaerobaculia bacterium]